MSFDIFGDFKTRGYLRNVGGLLDPESVKRLEHSALLTNTKAALTYLSEQARALRYEDLLTTHWILFQSVYPWAGKDRAELAPDKTIFKAGRSDWFAHPADCERVAQYAMSIGNKGGSMRAAPGEVMGHLAHAHPFLDGNGRSILCLHTELARRAGISIDWSSIEKREYLTAMTRQIESPDLRALDEYLKPHIRLLALPLTSGGSSASNEDRPQ